MNTKQYIAFITIGIVAIGAIYFFGSQKKYITRDTHVARACYYYAKENPNSGFPDRAWLTYVKINDQVQGLYHNLPSQSDSKTGPFTGVITSDASSSGTALLDVIWTASAEGMQDQEQLLIRTTRDTAQALFGQSVQGSDGVYRYTNTDNLFPSFLMTAIDCEILDDTVIVENYIRNNIRTITSKKPVLGGNWYVVSVDINAQEKTAIVQYEDGHIQEIDTFTYERTGENVALVLKN